MSKKLNFAKNFFETHLKNEFSVTQLIELLTKIEKTKVLTYSVQDKYEATLIFETTNDRGKALSNLEKTKSFLMYKTYVSSNEPEGLLSNIQSRFSSIYKTYSELEEIIDENSLLQYNFIAFEKWKSTKDRKEYQIYMEMMKNNINNLLNKKENEKTLEYIDKYSNTLKETFNTVSSINSLNCDEFVDVKILSHLATFWPLLIKSFKLDRTECKVNFKKICRLCEIFSFRVYSILGGMSNKGQSSIFARARDFNGNFDVLRKQLIEDIEYFGPKSKFIEYISDSDFFEYYSTTTKNYFFWKYENYLRRTEQPVASPIENKTFLSKDKRTKFSIEHIIPQHPNEVTLKIITDKLKYENVNETFKEIYLHCISNLTIDPISANSSKGNKDIEIKISNYFRKAPYKSQNELDTFLVNNTWTHESIIKRKEKLIRFSEKQWCSFD